MDNKPIQEFTDLELAQLQRQTYEQFLQTQNNLMIISQEINRRTQTVPTFNFNGNVGYGSTEGKV